MNRFKILGSTLVVILFTITLVPNTAVGRIAKTCVQELPSIEPAPDDRYLGDGWGEGYSWGSQPVLGSTTLNVSMSVNLKFDGSGGVSVSGGVSNRYNWISCCNPSNALSACNFSSNNNNCIRY